MLDPIHNQGLRLALGAVRTSPVASLYVEADEPSLYRRREKPSNFAKMSATVAFCPKGTKRLLALPFSEFLMDCNRIGSGSTLELWRHLTSRLHTSYIVSPF